MPNFISFFQILFSWVFRPLLRDCNTHSRLLQYKKAMRKYQNSLKRAKIKSSEKDKKVDHTKIRMKHKKANQTIEASSQKVSSEKSNPPNAHALFTPQKRRQSDFGAAVDIFLTHIQAGGSNAQEEFAELCVDMNDDEIRNLWAPGHYPPQKYVPIMPITEVSLSNAMFCAEIGSDMCCGLCSDVPQPSEVWLGGYAM